MTHSNDLSNVMRVQTLKVAIILITLSVLFFVAIGLADEMTEAVSKMLFGHMLLCFFAGCYFAVQATPSKDSAARRALESISILLAVLSGLMMVHGILHHL